MKREGCGASLAASADADAAAAGPSSAAAVPSSLSSPLACARSPVVGMEMDTTVQLYAACSEHVRVVLSTARKPARHRRPPAGPSSWNTRCSSIVILVIVSPRSLVRPRTPCRAWLAAQVSLVRPRTPCRAWLATQLSAAALPIDWASVLFYHAYECGAPASVWRRRPQGSTSYKTSRLNN